MPIYKYKASIKDGRIIESEEKAESREDLVRILHDQGYMVISIQEKIGIDLREILDIQVGGLPLKEKVFFTKQLAAMLKAGLPVVQSLEIMLEQTKNSALRKKLTSAYKDVKSGLALSKSFGKYELIFDALQLSLIEAGEQSGNLVEVMQQIAIDMDKSNRLRSKVRGALIYPAVVLLTAVVVVIILVMFMIPAVEGLYADLGANPDDIPAITRFLVSISDFLSSPVGLISTLVGIIALFFGYKSFYRGEFGRKFMDKFFLRMPVFGQLVLKSQVMQMVRLLALLLKSGIPIIDAIKATSKSLSNIHFVNTLEYTAEQVAKGSTISQPLSSGGVVPLMVIKMIATGEDTGSLDNILKDLTEFYEAEVEDLTSNLTKLMEPIMLLIVGGIVAFLAVAVYLPIYSIANFA